MNKTKQEAFDISLKFIRDQKYKPSYNENDDGILRYKNDQGLGCGIYPLLKENYNPKLEGKDVDDPAVLQAISDSGYDISDDSKVLYRKLQTAHDTFLYIFVDFSGSGYEDFMKQVAENHRLTYKAPT